MTWAMVVCVPWPWECVPTTAMTLPVGSIRTCADSVAIGGKALIAVGSI